MNVNASGTGVNSIYAGQFGMGQQMDAVSKNLQKQIENAKKQLQELAGNTEMLPEEKPNEFLTWAEMDVTLNKVQEERYLSC